MENIDIFVGGPMGKKVQDGQGIRLEDHTKNVVTALTQIMDELEDEARERGKNLHLLNPLLESVGDINTRILSMIDRAELGVFALSSSSPSAIYEVALMHALGKPTIPIAFSDHVVASLKEEGVPDLQKLPYYLRTQYALLVDDFNVQTLVDGLRDKIRLFGGLATLQDETDPASNPITIFYNLPLLDVSATTGLAAGYFNNFLQFQLRDRKTVFSHRPDLEEFVILVPSNLDEVGGMLDDLKKAAAAKGTEVVRIREKDGQPIQVDEQVRGEQILDSVGRFIVDIPAPLKAQKFSPRYVKLLRDEAAADTPEKKETVNQRKIKLEQAMIDKFFSVVRSMASREDFRSSRLKFMSISELMDQL